MDPFRPRDEAAEVAALSAQFEKIKALPAFAEALAAEDRARGDERAALLDQIERAAADHARDQAARARAIDAARAATAKARAALREAQGRQAAAEQSADAAERGFDQRRAQIEARLGELGGAIVDRLLFNLRNELGNARQQHETEAYCRDEYGREVFRSRTRDLDAHAARVAALIERATPLRLAKATPKQIEAEAAAIRAAARIGTARFYLRFGCMPPANSDPEKEVKA